MVKNTEEKIYALRFECNKKTNIYPDKKLNKVPKSDITKISLMF